MIDRNIWFNLASNGNTGKPGIRPNTNKMVRFNIVVPLFKANQIFFPIEMKNEPIMQEMLNELTLASPSGFKSKRDDFVDTISMLGSLTTWRPSEVSEIVQDTNNIWDMVEDNSHDTYVLSDSYIV
jgi:phage terminase large subunit-like protein